MVKCEHQFILIEQRIRPLGQGDASYDIEDSTAANVEVIPGRWEDEFGARVGCPICGEIRTVWANGEVEIEKQGNGRKF